MAQLLIYLFIMSFFPSFLLCVSLSFIVNTVFSNVDNQKERCLYYLVNRRKIIQKVFSYSHNMVIEHFHFAKFSGDFATVSVLFVISEYFFILQEKVCSQSTFQFQIMLLGRQWQTRLIFLRYMQKISCGPNPEKLWWTQDVFDGRMYYLTFYYVFSEERWYWSEMEGMDMG